ncbi:hypothetical protein CD934_23435 [Streptomyces calvus]|uniref:Uncharacterized protein n=1 Tax=Streptomyces calvus TaxID=67282 RepID=A0A514JVE8_9ACTN|nr:hypothetical protein CD934_23435 [Streptomyces calvus]
MPGPRPAGSREPGAGSRSREPGAVRPRKREPGAGPWCSRAGYRVRGEPGAVRPRNREPGAGSRALVFPRRVSSQG